MFKLSVLCLGILVTACGGYKSQEDSTLGPRIYLIEAKAKGDPSLFANYACPENDSKIQICHVPPGNPANKHTICIGLSAVDAHVGHHIAGNGEQDYLGACNASQPPPTDTTGDDSGGTVGGTTGTTDGTVPPPNGNDA